MDFATLIMNQSILTNKERVRMRKADELIALLVKMADKFDREGDFDLASDVDQTLLSMSARPRAPLKGLDDDVKKNLIIFLHDSDKNMGSSIKGLKEFFRRLRYFDIADHIKEMGLDRIVRDMEKTRGGIGAALKQFYERTHGKKPSQKDIDGLSGDDGEIEQSSLDFFDAQMVKDEEKLEEKPEGEDEELEEKLECGEGEELELEPGDEELEELLEDFWAELEEENNE